MQCGRVQLQERSKITNRYYRPLTPEKPRRYCQKRLVNPEHEEDPRWIDVLDRFHCNDSEGNSDGSHNNNHTPDEDLFLTVQNLKFQGNEQERKRPRTGFKYKTLSDGNKHRMFVKQQVKTIEIADDDRSSQLTCYYDEYAKYLTNADRSRPSTGKSSTFLQGLSTTFKKNKAVQVDFAKPCDTRKPRNGERKAAPQDVETKEEVLENKTSSDEAGMEDTKISFHKSGKRKSLTISRAQSPETVQVIRVDVVCNYSTSSTPSDDEKKQPTTDVVEKLDKKVETVNLKNSHYANKYLLTNTIKTLDENIAGSAKVTLFCKTFRLSDRSRASGKKLGVAKSSVQHNKT
ncbi:uncharacterized protein LOC126380250 [Pectinophora gossypiella]|uniref:uncharacterized protein LOC126380250 n=1 Tax=Pectinophora gossypiella TaxID=13191 RepID=UPI00214E1DB0|nr:uncharacterized protein LOC126380250 [Pectinophora gossypiella]